MPTAPVAPRDGPSDKRHKMLEAALRKHGNDPHSLIEVLHTAQELFGHLAPELLWHVSRALDIPPSKVYGVATFYHFFTLAPQGEHACTVCLGTACFVKRAADIVAAIERQFDVKAGGMTRDGRLSLNVARCVGSCGLAPVAIIDGATISKAAPGQVVQALQAVTAGAKGKT